MPAQASPFLRRTLSVGVVAAAFAYVGASLDGRPSHAQAPHPSTAQTVAFTQPTLIADVAEKALPSVVSIRTERAVARQHPLIERFFRRYGNGEGLEEFEGFEGEGELRDEEVEREIERLVPSGQGSGVIVDKSGTVVTNHHVVADADAIIVVLADGTELRAKKKGSDPQSDLAVLQIEAPPKSLVPLPWGDSETLRLGEIVLAIGNPFGLEGTVTMGIVSAKGRSDVRIAAYEDFIQTDAAINPGNSGGALIDLHGRLVGINSAIASRSGGSNGVGFAIPTHMVRPIVADLLDDGHVSRAKLGVHLQELTPDLATKLELQRAQGALVAHVEQGSPAEKAGFQRGDVVVEVDDRPVRTTSQLRNYVSMRRVGSDVDVTVMRGGKERVLHAKLGAMDGPVVTAEEKAEDRSALAGVTVAPLDSRTRALAQVPDGLQGGVVVVDIDEDSEAAREGLRKGDVILEVDRQAVSDVAGFNKAVGSGKGAPLLLIRRKAETRYLTWTR